MDRESRERDPGRGPARGEALLVRTGAEGGGHRAVRLHFELRQRSRIGGGPGRGARRASFAGGRPAGRGRRAVLGPDRRAVRAFDDGGACGPGPDVPLHDSRLGREDPDGLFVTLRDGGVDRDEGPVRCRVRLRHRSRPPRDCNAQRRVDESEPLPGSGDLVPVFQPAGLEGERGGRQNDGVEQHHRPGGEGPGAAA